MTRENYVSRTFYQEKQRQGQRSESKESVKDKAVHPNSQKKSRTENRGPATVVNHATGKRRPGVSWLSLQLVCIALVSLLPLAFGYQRILSNGYLAQGMIVAAARIFAAVYWHSFRYVFFEVQIFFLFCVLSSFFFRSLRGAIVFSGMMFFLSHFSTRFFRLIFSTANEFSMVIHSRIEYLSRFLPSGMTESLQKSKQVLFQFGQGESPLARLNHHVLEILFFLVIAGVFISVRRLLGRKEKNTFRKSMRAIASVPWFSRRFHRLAFLALVPFLVGSMDWLIFPHTKRNAPNVLLISVDTLRADHLQVYGYSRKTSPQMDRLARQGVLFERAISQSSWTLPSHASMFSGLYPAQHGCVFQLTDKLGVSNHTFAERLLNEGYRTMAVTSVVYLSPTYGLDQGFERFVLMDGEIAENVVDKALSLLKKREDRPFFLFVHLFDPHEPYTPPLRYSNYFANSPHKASLSTEKKKYIFDGEVVRISDKGMADFIDSYDGEIRYVDDQLARVFSYLRAQGILDSTIVILTSDHGESFGEHNLWGHHSSLYNEQIHVPLILRYPLELKGPQRIAPPVDASVRIMPTVLEMVGITDRHLIAGSLLPMIEAQGTGKVNTAYSELHISEDYLWSVVQPDWKLVATQHGNKDTRPKRVQLFDPVDDWRDDRDVADFHPDVVQQLITRHGTKLQEMHRAYQNQDHEQVELSDEQIQRLKELGYL